VWGNQAGAFRDVKHPLAGFRHYIGSAVYRCRAFERVGLFNRHMGFAEDPDWFNRAAEVGLTAKRIQEVSLIVGSHSGNMTLGKWPVELGMIQAVKNQLERWRQGLFAARQSPGPTERGGKAHDPWRGRCKAMAGFQLDGALQAMKAAVRRWLGKLWAHGLKVAGNSADTLREWALDAPRQARGQGLPRAAWDGTPPLRCARIEASTACQLHCPSCPQTSGQIHRQLGTGLLAPRDMERFLALNPSLQTLELANYGEALLNPALPDLLAMVAARGMSISFDGGLNLNCASQAALGALVRYPVSVIKCSLDGATQETYARYRIGGKLASAIEHIRCLNALKQERSTTSPRLVWQFVIFSHNLHELPSARAMAHELGMEFEPVLSWDRRLAPGPQQHAEMLRRSGLKVRSQEEFAQRHGKHYRRWLCAQIWVQPQVNWDGRVLGCCVNSWRFFPGNAFAASLSELAQQRPLQAARRMLLGLSRSEPSAPCFTCHYYAKMRQHRQWLTPEEIRSAEELLLDRHRAVRAGHTSTAQVPAGASPPLPPT